jgi:hypothetical protein
MEKQIGTLQSLQEVVKSSIVDCPVVMTRIKSNDRPMVDSIDHRHNMMMRFFGGGLDKNSLSMPEPGHFRPAASGY